MIASSGGSCIAPSAKDYRAMSSKSKRKGKKVAVKKRPLSSGGKKRPSSSGGRPAELKRVYSRGYHVEFGQCKKKGMADDVARCVGTLLTRARFVLNGGACHVDMRSPPKVPLVSVASRLIYIHPLRLVSGHSTYLCSFCLHWCRSGSNAFSDGTSSNAFSYGKSH